MTKIIIVDRGKELSAEFKTMMANDYRMTCSHISTRSSQVKEIVERTLTYTAVGSAKYNLYIPQ